METWQVAVLTLSAVFVGMMIPVLLQLRTTLREAQREVHARSERLGLVLEDAGVIAQRLRRATDAIEGKEHEIGAIVSSAGELARSLDRLRSTAHVASAVAVAVGAGLRAFRHDWQQGISADPDVAPALSEINLSDEQASPTNGERNASR